MNIHKPYYNDLSVYLENLIERKICVEILWPNITCTEGVISSIVKDGSVIIGVILTSGNCKHFININNISFIKEII